jgi:heme/copper-type cytochrome/quinol oxidase subunit 1
MASITAQQAIAPAMPIQRAPAEATSDADAEHGLARFFYAAGLALIISAVQGVVQRLPGISDWLRNADYGGHMVTNLAHTHITIVGAGTITLTGLIYYVLPRVTRKPLYSQSLTNVSFWATLIGVFGFYLAMLCLGIYEGAMVHAGWPYDAARDYMGAWHKMPMMMTGIVMGIGYWTFVGNVYNTVGRGAGERKIDPANAATDGEFLLAKFLAVGATGLLFGTVQGVYQIMPWSLDWLRKTGEAGHLIDPMAHAHMNLVGGVAVAIMGLLYFFLPKMIGRPIYSMRLAKLSFWFILIGLFGFYFTAVTLGWIEGEMVLGGMTDVEARETLGLWHSVPLALAGIVMGIGFWTFIANILLTVRQRPSNDAPADNKLRYFIGFSAIALLIGTIQGVIQILGPVKDWLDEALPASYLVTPLSHAQLNMVGFVMVSLASMAVFLLPRILKRPVTDRKEARVALTVMATGIMASYVVYFTVGLVESLAIHQGATPSEAMEIVAGRTGRYSLLIGAQAILGIGYILFFRHVASVVGREMRRAYFKTFWGRMSGAGQQATRIHPKAVPTNLDTAHRKALTACLIEAVGGAAGFLGMGWVFSGRPFVGIMLLGSWAGGFWTFAYVVFAVSGGAQLLPFLMVPYFTIPVLSAIGCYRSYMRDARSLLVASM